MTQNNSAARGPRGEQRRQRAGPASPARRPVPTLPRGQEPTGGNPAGRAQARRPPRRPSPSNGDTARRGQTARSSTALKHVARNPASLPGAAAAPPRFASRSLRTVRSARPALPFCVSCFHIESEVRKHLMPLPPGQRAAGEDWLMTRHVRPRLRARARPRRRGEADRQKRVETTASSRPLRLVRLGVRRWREPGPGPQDSEPSGSMTKATHWGQGTGQAATGREVRGRRIWPSSGRASRSKAI